MKTSTKYLLGFCFLFFGVLNLRAQEGFVAAGGEDTGSGGTVSFSIGQVDYLTATGPGGTITEGLQQPFEILIVSGIEKTAITLSVYPNPATDFVMLGVKNANTENLTYGLYDLQGSLIAKQKINADQTSISLTGLANAVYFIKVFNNDNNELKIFKVIKN